MENRTEIGSIGEFGLINRLADSFKSHQGWTKVGIGDDAAVLDSGGK